MASSACKSNLHCYKPQGALHVKPRSIIKKYYKIINQCRMHINNQTLNKFREKIAERKFKTMSTIKAYGKVSEVEQMMLDARRRTRKRIAIIVLSSIVLVGVVIGAVLGTASSRNGGSSNNGGNDNSFSTSNKAVCDITLYPDSCYSALSPLKNSTELKPDEIVKTMIQAAISELSKASDYIFNDAIKNSTDNMTIQALKNCEELLDLAVDHLNMSLSSSDISLTAAMDDLQTWLSSATTYQQTCIDGFEDINGALKDSIAGYLKNSTEFSSNGLAIVNWLSSLTGSLKLRRLMGEPEWVSPATRRLLQSDLRKQADIVVAKDGSGKFKTIKAALKAVPEKSNKRTVIYVKKGLYYENVKVEKTMWNVVMVGDGMTNTVVSANLNFIDGTPTFSSATFAAMGQNFIARDMGFRNTAGASKHQAVALMSTSDQSVFYRCHFDAFQDTLYAHSNRQFYRECNIYGTVDFIFGNSAVVLQSSFIFPRLPMQGQQNTITAQGKFDPNQNTGISIQNCAVMPFGNLGLTQTYLGRPWKNYSTTVYIQNNLGALINPNGWLPWIGDSAPSTIFYAEFQNFGAGSSTAKRVKWKGVRNINAAQASKFTVSSFLQGAKWISAAGVPFKAGL